MVINGENFPNGYRCFGIYGFNLIDFLEIFDKHKPLLCLNFFKKYVLFFLIIFIIVIILLIKQLYPCSFHRNINQIK